MTPAVLALLAVATELSELAKASLPKLRKGETVKREWLKDAIYYRETIWNGRKFIAQFDFRQRESRQMAV